MCCTHFNTHTNTTIITFNLPNISNMPNDSYPCVSLPDPQGKHFQHGPVLMSVASRCGQPSWQEWSLRRSDCSAVIHAHKRQAKGNACPGRAYSCGSAPRLDHVLPWFPRQHLHRKTHLSKESITNTSAMNTQVELHRSVYIVSCCLVWSHPPQLNNA